VKVKQWMAQVEHNYSATQNRINTDFGERKTPSFHVWNMRFSSYVVKGKHSLTYGFAVENISNKNYYEHLDVGYIPRMGRNFIFNLGYIFR
jgi:outer membrane receptor protein involved in Fe transport